MRPRTQTRRGWFRIAVLAAATALFAIGIPTAAGIVAGAGFTTTNPAVDNPTSDPDIHLCMNGPGTVNCNHYGAKEFVWANGGPNQTGPSALTAGTYFFAVLEPSGQNNPNDGGANNLSDMDPAGGAPTQTCQVTNPDFDPSDPLDPDPPTIPGTGCGDSFLDRSFTVSGGDISTNLGTHEDYLSGAQGLLIRMCGGDAVSGFLCFDDTSNQGGVYILALCQYDPTTYDPADPLADVDPQNCKYDAFKAPKAGETPCTENCTPNEFGVVSGTKYYDVNHNGQRDPGEVGIANWPINFNDGDSGTQQTDGSGNFSLSLLADDYTFWETQSPVAAWSQTGNTVDQSSASGGATVTLNLDKSYTVHVLDNSTASGLLFGNVCGVANSNGFTLGYWSNNNGRAVLAANDPGWRNLLNTLNLVKPSWSYYTISLLTQFGPTYNTFKSWLLSATATNMSYMLSAQLAATVLNIAYKGQNGNVLVLGPNGTWITVNQAVSEAITFLSTHLNTTAAGPDRTLAEKYKIIFDGLNNNTLQVTPPTSGGCPNPFPTP